MQMNFHRKLPIPKDVKAEFPLTERMEQVKAERDAEIKAVFDGTSQQTAEKTFLAVLFLYRN